MNNLHRAFFKEILQVGQNDHKGPIPGEKEKVLLQVYKQSIQCKHRAHILIGREREGSRDFALASPPIRCRDF